MHTALGKHPWLCEDDCSRQTQGTQRVREVISYSAHSPCCFQASLSNTPKLGSFLLDISHTLSCPLLMCVTFAGNTWANVFYPRKDTDDRLKKIIPPKSSLVNQWVYWGSLHGIQRQLHHQKSHLSTGNNSWKLCPWSSTPIPASRNCFLLLTFWTQKLMILP